MITSDGAADAGFVAKRRAEPILEAPGRPRLLVAVAVAAIALIVVAGFVLDFTEPDLPLAVATNRLHVGVVGTASSTVYRVFEPAPAIAITVAVTGIIWWVRKNIRPATAFAGVVAVTWVPSDAVKLLIGRPRPPMSALPHPYAPFQTDSSYPSGHVVFITAFVIALAMLLRSSRWGTLVRALAPLIVILAGTALTIDAVHYLSDVLASILWSAAVAPVARMAWVGYVMTRVRWLDPRQHITR